jgi:hypothetical protein
MEIREWLERYRRAWEERDPDAATALFTEDAVYRSHPFRHPHLRTGGIRAYWAAAVGDQSDVQVRFGEPIRAGDRAAVEWWTTFRDKRGEGTLAGVLVLRFAGDGRCSELREAWHYEPRKHEPPDGWGV